jgi:hypothetical protein
MFSLSLLFCNELRLFFFILSESILFSLILILFKLFSVYPTLLSKSGMVLVSTTL